MHESLVNLEHDTFRPDVQPSAEATIVKHAEPLLHQLQTHFRDPLHESKCTMNRPSTHHVRQP